MVEKCTIVHRKWKWFFTDSVIPVLHRPCYSTVIHRLLPYRPCDSTVLRHCFSTVLHWPCSSTVLRRPCYFTFLHRPCNSIDPVYSLVLHRSCGLIPCFFTLLYNPCYSINTVTSQFSKDPVSPQISIDPVTPQFSTVYLLHRSWNSTVQYRPYHKSCGSQSKHLANIVSKYTPVVLSCKTFACVRFLPLNSAYLSWPTFYRSHKHIEWDLSIM